MHVRAQVLSAVVASAATLASLQSIPAADAAALPAITNAVSAERDVGFEVFLPLTHREALEELIRNQQDPKSPQYHRWLTPEQFARSFGPTAQSIARVRKALETAGFTITETHSRSMHVVGTTDAVQRSFATRLNAVRGNGGLGKERLVATSHLRLPAALAAEGAVIGAFGNRPMAQPHAANLGLVSPENRYSNVGPYWYGDLRQAYDYPSLTTPVNGKILDGTGANVAIVMENDVLDSDIQAMFDHEHYTTTTGKDAPTLAGRVYIAGGAPFDPDASFEASLDVQQVLGGAPGSAVTLVDLPDLSDQNVLAGYLYIVESNAYDLVNSSFGGCELFYSAKYNGGQDYYGILDTYDSLFAQGNAQGITFVASSGDSGGKGCPDVSYFSGDPNATPKFVAGIQFPSDSPHVTAVGGTNLVTTTPPDPQTTPTTLTSAYVSENGFGDPEVPYDPYGIGLDVSGGYWGAGGGISRHFGAPSYQTMVNTHAKMRTTPDVGMQVGGCPGGISARCGANRSAAVVALGGSFYGVIGTSVSSPEFVSALALAVQIGGRLGQVNTYLYKKAALQNSFGGLDAPSSLQYFHRNVPGFDGLYFSNYKKADYNYITGNGTPDIRRLFGFMAADPAGDPQTPSNP